MHLAAIDQMANNGASIIHDLRPVTKIIMVIALLAGVIISNKLISICLVLAAVMFLIILSKVSLKEIGHLAVYPIFFSLVFALFRISDSLLAGLQVVLKSLGAALCMLFLITTTPYTQVFAFFSLFLPRLLVDIFVFTYRSLFILLDRIESVLRVIKLRGGYHPFRMLLNLKNTAGIMGIMIIRSIDMSERMYQIYSLRGYDGQIPVDFKWGPVGVRDIIMILFAVLILTMVVIAWSL